MYKGSALQPFTGLVYTCGRVEVVKWDFDHGICKLHHRNVTIDYYVKGVCQHVFRTLELGNTVPGKYQ